MKKALLLAAALVVLPALTLFAQDESMMSMEQAMELGKPGPEHQILKKMAGDAKISYSMKMAPDQPAMHSAGTSTSKMILGNRFLQMEVTTVASDGPLKDISWTGIHIFGFDRRFKKYTLISLDEMGTYYVTAEGDYDEASKELRFTGTDEWPGMGKMTFKMVYDLSKDNQTIFKLYYPGPDGKMFLMMEGVAVKK